MVRLVGNKCRMGLGRDNIDLYCLLFITLEYNYQRVESKLERRTLFFNSSSDSITRR